MSFHRDGSNAPAGAVFVFGSNLSGIHGGGAARAAAVYYGAERGVGEGPTGRSYALPTVAHNIAGPLPLATISGHVATFLDHARANPQTLFFVTRIGCSLAGYVDGQIAPMFRGAPENCSFAEQWRDHLEVAP